jgi:hypothetical protein
MMRSLEARLYYPALLVALTVPDICAALTMDDATLVRGEHYSAFVDKYTVLNGFERNGLGLNGTHCYQLRCGVVHRGNAAGNRDFPSTHVIFTVPESNALIHGGKPLVSGDKTATTIDLVLFCKAMAEAARHWMRDHATHPKVTENMPRLLSWRPDGMPPFISGYGVVASGVSDATDGGSIISAPG